MNGGTAIIIIALVVIGILAVRSTVKHMTGKGGCCGGGSSVPPELKHLEGKEVGKYLIQIGGMHCDNCKNRVEHGVNQLQGAVGTADVSRGVLTVHCDRPIAEAKIRKAVEKAGYTVVSVQYLPKEEK